MDKLIRAVLTNPLVMAVKRVIRDLVWTLKGRRLANPPPPHRPGTLMFVCFGNICRSAFAEYRGNEKLAALGIEDVVCVSSGIRARDGKPSPEQAVLSARACGVDLTPHGARRIDRGMMVASDMVFVMEQWQMESLAGDFPDLQAKLFLLPLLESELGSSVSGYSRYNLADPYGKSPAEFEACFQRLDRCLDLLFDRLYGG
ncbi:MAG: hypothetical protein IFK94_11980 [Acidobacteria bacterium]|uniref:protein-tyrosine-phosphatase n=1 Tax=Candidatus Polarisedimenticola svalbardensis TaxID=2886004 RepID=A0A8J7C336_9BACT|nr:hypothetical protein [Candidatus Polarisedimenticola svalbardensis]